MVQSSEASVKLCLIVTGQQTFPQNQPLQPSTYHAVQGADTLAQRFCSFVFLYGKSARQNRNRMLSSVCVVNRDSACVASRVHTTDTAKKSEKLACQQIKTTPWFPARRLFRSEARNSRFAFSADGR